jgi:hypothetical protein
MSATPRTTFHIKRKIEREPVNGNVPDPLEDADDPVPQSPRTLPLTITALRTGGRRVPRRPP